PPGRADDRRTARPATQRRAENLRSRCHADRRRAQNLRSRCRAHRRRRRGTPMILEPPVRPIDAEPPAGVATGAVVGPTPTDAATPPPGDAEPTLSLRRASLAALLSAAAAAWMLGGVFDSPLARPRPVVLAGALLQPPDGGVLGAGVSLVLVIAALMVLYAAELSGGGGGRGFELRRSLRGAAALAVALVALMLLNRSNFLFPAAV